MTPFCVVNQYKKGTKMELLTLQETAKILAYSKDTLYRLTSQKKIEHVKLFNGGIRFKKETIYKMIEQGTIKPKLF